MPDDRATPETSALGKPYPRHCGECGSVAVEAVTIPYAAEVKHDGRLHQFPIRQLQIDRCTVCGEDFFSSLSDIQLTAGLRAHLSLLQPDEIKDGLSALGLTQKTFAARLGVAPETVSRWLTGHVVQSRPLDNLMRLFFDLPIVRDALCESHYQSSGAPLPSANGQHGDDYEKGARGHAADVVPIALGASKIVY